MTKKEAEIDEKVQLRTGKERWALLKLVSKIGLQFKNKNMEGPWKNDEDVRGNVLFFCKFSGTPKTLNT